MAIDDSWDGTERRKQWRRGDLAELAVAVGYLRRSVDELSLRLDAQSNRGRRRAATITVVLVFWTFLLAFGMMQVYNYNVHKCVAPVYSEELEPAAWCSWVLPFTPEANRQ